MAEQEVAQTRQITKARDETSRALTLARKQEFLASRVADRVAKQQRRERWISKTQCNPFATDQWAEDEKVYQKCVATNRAEVVARDNNVRQEKASSLSVIRAGLSAHDELVALRWEKKHLLEEKALLKAKRDFDKVQSRLDSVSKKKDEFDRMMQSKPQLQRWSSDLCVIPLRKGDGAEVYLKKVPLEDDKVALLVPPKRPA